MNSKESKVYRAICDNDVTTLEEISLITDIHTASIRRAIASLTKKGLITRIGSNRSGRWIRK